MSVLRVIGRIAVALLAVLGVIFVILAVTYGPRFIGEIQDHSNLNAFYDQPKDAAEGKPGTIIKAEQLEGHPLNADAWRIMYRTTDLNGKPVVTTGVVVTPHGQAPQGGRTVLAWGHPTTGVADRCAPSRGFDPLMDIEGLRAMLERGYTVTATDYVGLGTAGPDSYLIGATEGNSVLDSVRAAQELEGAQAGSDVILWGHSQGGQAVLFAAEQAPKYTPELKIQAVAAAAPAADLPALIESHLNDISGATIGSYAIEAYSEVYKDRGANVDSVLTPEGQKIIGKMNELCLLSNMREMHSLAEPAVGNFFAVDPTKTEPWASLLKENSAGNMATHAPLFVAQGMKDHLVVPSATETFVKQQKKLGTNVTFYPIKNANHGTVALFAIPGLLNWLDGLGV